MDEMLRLAIRNEIHLFMEEEKQTQNVRILEEKEKEIKMTAWALVAVSPIAALLLSFSSAHVAVYLLSFLLFYALSGGILYKIGRTDFHPDTKRGLLLIPVLLMLFGLILPLVLMEYGILF